MISCAYAGIQKMRQRLYRSHLFVTKQLPCKVISIGNITVGGTGKTPMTIALAQRLDRLGLKVVVVSRGYRGAVEKAGGLVSNGRQVLLTPGQAGDEPFMMACRLRPIPVVIGRDRAAAGALAAKKFQPDVIILDDAFQHLQLARDIDLVLLDCASPFGNSHLLPRGSLREPVSALSRADAFILTRSNRLAGATASAALARLRAALPNRPIFTSSHHPYGYIVKHTVRLPFHEASRHLSPSEFQVLRGHKVFVFSGIARNDDFQRTVTELGFKAVGFCQFSDHHLYSSQDFSAILQGARDSGAEFLITTEKDHARIAGHIDGPLDLIVIGVKIDFGDDENRFNEFIEEKLAN